VTAGANEGPLSLSCHIYHIGMFSAFAAFLDEGDEVIVMEPYFDQVPRNVLCSSTHYFE
jgi:hypothetical protein